MDRTSILRTEIALPAYAGKSDAEIADMLNVKERPSERSIVNGYEVIDCIAPAALAALTAIQLQRLGVITSASGGVNIKNPNIRTIVADIFPASATNNTTRAALGNLKDAPEISRGEELGLGWVGTGHVTEARGKE